MIGPFGLVWGSSPLTRGKLGTWSKGTYSTGLIPAHAGKTRGTRARCAVPTAHPRSRGENTTPTLKLAQIAGSSPLTRGKLHLPALPGTDARLIPAHAGKTPSPGAPWHGCAAHPRSRGENCSRSTSKIVLTGSSPLTRGKRGSTARHWRLRRLIPAHAGKTWCKPSPSTSFRAHPRSRGENFRSSLSVCRGGRLIPAHAGKTTKRFASRWIASAHPRSRGENAVGHCDAARLPGSSPLTRGKPGDHAAPDSRQRLIPAHAGKTWDLRVGGETDWAHPRSRGENLYPRSSSSLVRGSSPLTRGKRATDSGGGGRGRLIPAHAGKTSASTWIRSEPRAHPRSRGENRDGRPERLRPGRLIPAHAGKTLRWSQRPPEPPAHPRSRGENTS